MFRPNHVLLMIGTDPFCRHRRRTLRSEEQGGISTRSIKHDHVVRHRDRNTAQRRDRLIHPPAGLQHVAQHQNDRKPLALGWAAAEREAYDEAILVHAVEAAAPGPLSFRDHLAPEPRSGLEAIRHLIEREVVVANQGRPVGPEPYRLAAAADDRWR